MNLQEIEQNVEGLDLSQGFDFIYDLLRAYGIPKASISRLKSGTYDRSKSEAEHLWKGKLYYRYVENEDDLYVLIDDAKNDEHIMRERPRFLIVRNEERLLAIDTKVETTLDIAISDLPGSSAFFLPWAGIEKTQLESLNYADIKAAEKMARLYDEIVKHNTISSTESVHDLNVFFSRLLFCLFAEDTGVFPKGCFTNAIASLTKESGEDTDSFLDELFEVLDTAPRDRGGLASHFVEFGYVNGNLFARRSSAPQFSSKARRVILECGTLNWSQINPDIFGSMIQAVVHPSQREGLGMHYTSVENIMKVIRPLFLDELNEAVEQAVDSVQKLERLLDRICRIKLFDPACGSGNFLVISYKELRRLEHRILERIVELDHSKRGLFKLSGIKLENFYGVEIDDFAHEIAILSLWLAKHQMNVEFSELFGVEISLIPLKETGNIVWGNALRLDWKQLLGEPGTSETYICGNPPYLGSRNQTAENKADLRRHHPRFKSLDYVSGWVVLAAQMVREGWVSAAGLVTTNSITQGEQVGILWPTVLDHGVELGFAHQSFRWTNDARGKAGVTCVVLGLQPPRSGSKLIYSNGNVRTVSRINPYLVEGETVTVTRSSKPISDALPLMTYGCLANDGGNLLLSRHERDELLASAPEAARWLKPFWGGIEFLRGVERWCLYIPDSELNSAQAIPEVARRLSRVTTHRSSSTEVSTRRLAKQPNRFYFDCYRESECIIVPSTTSERRVYIPIGYLSKDVVISNAANAIYEAEPWIFGLIQSRMHVVWVRAVGGRLKSDLRYSAVLCYNTFPVAPASKEQRDAVAERAFEVLQAREHFADKTLAQLYDPGSVPNGLLRAHQRLDEVVDGLYRNREFESDEERLELLFAMYSKMTSQANLGRPDA